MARWLVKQEPSGYAYSDLARERRTRWDGVHNALALRHLRAMRPGDEALFYHSGEERACVGTLRIVGEPRLDERDARGSWYVDVAAGRPLRRPVTLAELKGDPAFRGFDLLRISRLSVLPVPQAMWDRILELAESGPRPPVTGETTGRARAAGRPPARPTARRRR